MQKSFAIFASELITKPNIMSNYPAGAENNSNAPFNQGELQGENVYLLEYLQNLDMPKEVYSELQKFQFNLDSATSYLIGMSKEVKEFRPELSLFLLKIKDLISEPYMFIENE